ncbi:MULTISPECIES: acyl-CoA carboxylase epsilon subunit [Auritidibacter]|uniref:Acyl-CoA carboxylase epsilon subunit n=1 Tax=Auritidibacter ignavus TaxID=678932 RepID=A0AAJ6AQ49_9MICC|nr:MULTISPECIES: acyl-CoA carboxylase epsilon subunit [Auritidibacter]NIH72774.1 hypothetical protein [Auritidibacter ignavus]WGH82613.1 acyl-CoA carboxylase epsilon subunit [Auritidibacter ignavus]WGH84821.1 acyl-CoA carboxylase epsilon subunit [Auritidibacter ignavus]WGH87198.1 acyl-CoA carboxylase epsilon subunit [Auritidibacter ignavus]WGH89484.1 acyl-CoA carboxylase epsilon subunit [Auritidibacter ignavus]
MSVEEHHDPTGMIVRGGNLTAEDIAAATAVVGIVAMAQPETAEDREKARARRFSHRRRVSTWNRDVTAHWRISAGED